jgi:glycosyltransferase involved in cell wall biosynthesis
MGLSKGKIVDFGEAVTEKVVSRTVQRAMDTPPQVSVVVPARDECDNIVPLVHEIIEALEGLFSYEIIYIDDGSVDGTLETLRRLQQELPCSLRVLSNACSYGQSLSLLTGVRAAKAPLIATLDADGQNVPADIPRLLVLASERPQGSHFCIAGYRSKRHDTAYRRMQSRIANGIRRAVLRDATPDTGCGLKLMPRETWLSLPAFDHMHRFLPALVQRIGGQVLVEEVQHRARLNGTSKYGMIDRLLAGIVDLAGVVWLSRRLREVKSTEIVKQ